MIIEDIIFSTPVPKDKKLLDSVDFLTILKVKYQRLHSLILDKDKDYSDTIKDVLFDFEKLNTLISNIENFTFLQYVVGTKYIELGLKFNNDIYLEKGIRALDSIDEKNIEPYNLKADYYRLFSRAILLHFNNEIKKDNNYRYSFRNIEPLLKSKYFLFKLYTFIIEGKIKLDKSLEARITTDLVSNLVFLSRWNEPFYILDRRSAVSDYNPKYVSLLKGHTLNEMAWYTCCSIYPAMMYEVKRFIGEAKGLPMGDKEGIDMFARINSESDEIIKDNGIDLEEFEKNYGDTRKEFENHSDYRKWILKNHLSLCEHAMYCFCGLSKSDNLSIKSNHEHTKIEWVYQFEILLDKMKSEYNLTRYFLFISEDESRLLYKREDEIEISFDESALMNNSASDYLLQAFKLAYSILDKIGRAIYLALDIEQKNIYFHKCWKRIKEMNVGTHNRYLYTLYSIACDLSDTAKYSAFKEYKDWRNLIEHEYLFLSNGRKSKEEILKKMPMIKEVVKIDEFREKTCYMLQLCRSAIFSFTFFIRHESKQKEKITKNSCLSDRGEM